jgi:hypothetical protein
MSWSTIKYGKLQYLRHKSGNATINKLPIGSEVKFELYAHKRYIGEYDTVEQAKAAFDQLQ